MIKAVTSLIVLLTSSCKAGHLITESAIQYKILTNYVINTRVDNNKSHFYFFTNSRDFNQVFELGKSSMGNVTVPDFTKNNIVAAALEASGNVTTLSIKSIVLKQQKLNVHYSLTDTTSWKTYPQSPYVIAIIDKNVLPEKVQFFLNDQLKQTITVHE